MGTEGTKLFDDRYWVVDSYTDALKRKTAAQVRALAKRFNGTVNIFPSEDAAVDFILIRAHKRIQVAMDAMKKEQSKLKRLQRKFKRMI